MTRAIDDIPAVPARVAAERLGIATRQLYRLVRADPAIPKRRPVLLTETEVSRLADREPAPKGFARRRWTAAELRILADAELSCREAAERIGQIGESTSHATVAKERRRRGIG